MNIYVASSWRNPIQPYLVLLLKLKGYDVYDFRHPDKDDEGFHWEQIDTNWEMWNPETFRESLDHWQAENGFKKDMDALKKCDICILVMPCGRSAHLELGYCVGAGKKTIILLSDGEPELMYKMVSKICCSPEEVIKYLGRIKPVR